MSDTIKPDFGEHSDQVELSDGSWWIRVDTGDRTTQENCDLYCELQEDLRKIGWQIAQGTDHIEHDCVSGRLERYQQRDAVEQEASSS